MYPDSPPGHQISRTPDVGSVPVQSPLLPSTIDPSVRSTLQLRLDLEPVSTVQHVLYPGWTGTRHPAAPAPMVSPVNPNGGAPDLIACIMPDVLMKGGTDGEGETREGETREGETREGEVGTRREGGETREGEVEIRREGGETREGETREGEVETRREGGETREGEVEIRREGGETREGEVETRRDDESKITDALPPEVIKNQLPPF